MAQERAVVQVFDLLFYQNPHRIREHQDGGPLGSNLDSVSLDSH